MRYKEILQALPPEVADRLLHNLELVKVTPTTDEAELLRAFEVAVSQTKTDTNSDLTGTERRMVHALLDMVPDAGVKMIFT